MAGFIVSYSETLAIRGFLTYLNKNYSRAISTTDTYLIAAIAAWVQQETGGLKYVKGNNPFNIRSSPLEIGQRTTISNGKFAVFASLAQGFMAAAYLLIHGNKAYGYQLALNALKHTGNQAAVDFLAAIAMSSWDVAHYGAINWATAYDPKQNHLLGVYVHITGVQLANPHPRLPKPKSKHFPTLPRGYIASASTHQYMDPWFANVFYHRRRRGGVAVQATKR